MCDRLTGFCALPAGEPISLEYRGMTELHQIAPPEALSAGGDTRFVTWDQPPGPVSPLQSCMSKRGDCHANL
jgi:hypothetical protein